MMLSTSLLTKSFIDFSGIYKAQFCLSSSHPPFSNTCEFIDNCFFTFCILLIWYNFLILTSHLHTFIVYLYYIIFLFAVCREGLCRRRVHHSNKTLHGYHFKPTHQFNESSKLVSNIGTEYAFSKGAFQISFFTPLSEFYLSFQAIF